VPWRRQDSLFYMKIMVLPIGLDWCFEGNNEYIVYSHFQNRMSNISNGSFQILELKVMSLATILNIHRLRNGILAVELVGLSEKKEKDSMI
jgi:hypothetical protein